MMMMRIRKGIVYYGLNRMKNAANVKAIIIIINGNTQRLFGVDAKKVVL